MDYRKSAQDVLRLIGGKENLISAAHCATRLRLVIADNKKCNKEALDDVDGVKGVFEASGQLQIIFGTGVVNKVYDEFIALAGVSAASKEDVKQAAASKANIFSTLHQDARRYFCSDHSCHCGKWIFDGNHELS